MGTAPQPQNWTGTSKGGAWGNRCFMFLIKHFGIVPAYLLLFFVSFGYALRDQQTKKAIREFRSHLGVPTTFFHIWRHVFAFGTSLIDRFAFLLGRGDIFRYTCIGEETIAALATSGQGAILLSAHVGNWELAGNLLRDRIDCPINIVTLDNENEAVRKVLETATKHRRINVLRLSSNQTDITVQIARALQAGEFVCLHGDRTVHQRSRKIDFLGAPAEFPIGPYALSSIFNSPILPVFVVKTGWRTYRMEAFDPIVLDRIPSEKRDTKILEAAKKFSELLESVVRAHPYEWHNFYAFWDSSAQ